MSYARIVADMLCGASAFNQDVGSWDVSNVFDMQAVFCNANSFDQDIGSWDVSGVTKSFLLLVGSGISSFALTGLVAVTAIVNVTENVPGRIRETS
jgi:hypothetical protein